MKHHIIQLIKDDVKVTQLVQTLEKLDILTGQYYLCNSSVIFYLMGIPDSEQMIEKYSGLIESAEFGIMNDPKKLTVFSIQVHDDLLEYVKP